MTQLPLPEVKEVSYKDFIQLFMDERVIIFDFLNYASTLSVTQLKYLTKLFDLTNPQRAD